MKRHQASVASLAVFFMVAGSALVAAGQQGQGPAQLPLSPTVRPTGQSVTGAYEGWFQNKDGSYSLLVGYFNRNQRQELEIPVGINNRIEPGGPDQGQPTHFLPGRQWGVFVVKVPKDFGDKKMTWTLVSNGQTNVITLHLNPKWVIEPYSEAGTQNTPPKLKFDPQGPAVTGPPTEIVASLKAIASEPTPLTLWVTDEGPKLREPPADGNEIRSRRGRGAPGSGEGPAPPPPLSVSWSKFRGPGTVAFDKARPEIGRTDGKAVVTATFSAPGEYILRIQSNDTSGEGGGGSQCCWTNAHVKVIVEAAKGR
jgi:hypothetical protein